MQTSCTHYLREQPMVKKTALGDSHAPRRLSTLERTFPAISAAISGQRRENPLSHRAINSLVRRGSVRDMGAAPVGISGSVRLSPACALRILACRRTLRGI